MDWYEVNNIEQVDSPAVLIYPDRVRQNIHALIDLVKDPARLRPHIKSNKIAEVCQLMLDAKITSFKCATIAEAEMLGTIGAPDVLLAYQPVGPKLIRFIKLIEKFKATKFSCLVDHIDVATEIAKSAVSHGLTISIYIDLNIGMNRTGVIPEHALKLYQQIGELDGVNFEGLHAYDGQIHEDDESKRLKMTEEGFRPVIGLARQIEASSGTLPKIIAGGSVTMPYYLQNPVQLPSVFLSPGTFIFWDYTYKELLPNEPFDYAALVITRVISIVDGTTITTDLGHKSVASEGPCPRIHFLNAPDAMQIGHSEEHMMLKVPDSSTYQPGDVLYGIPMHICPTVSMYEAVNVVVEREVISSWDVIARNKKITI